MNIKRIAKYLVLSAGSIIFAGALLVGYTVAAPSVEEYASRKDFDSSAWKKAEGSNDDIRIKMIDNLLRKHKLIGMPRSQIDSFLGKPDKTSYFSDYEYVYWLGPERGFISIDSEWLGLKFKDDVVTKVTLLRD